MMPSSNQVKPFASELISDLVFIIRYTPKALTTVSKYCFLGALVGWSSCYILQESWNNFAREHHSTIDPGRTYVPEDERYLKFSRHSQFNQVTPPIGEALPLYASLVGAGAAGFFALNQVVHDLGNKLHDDRIIRQFDIV